jgi:hypothetical protein
LESGKQASIRIEALEEGVTPTLNEAAIVDVRATLTRQTVDKAEKLASPRIIAKLGEPAELQIGQIAILTKASLVPQSTYWIHGIKIE